MNNIINRIIIAIIGVFFCLAITVRGADKNYYSQYLSLAEAKQLSGIKDLKENHNNNLTFTDAQGKNVFQIRFYSKEEYSKVTKESKYWTPVAGIGDQAKIGIPAMPYMIVFLKGQHTISVASFTEPKSGKQYLTVDQLKAICNVLEKNIAGKKNS